LKLLTAGVAATRRPFEVDLMYEQYQGKMAASCRESFGLPWILCENALHLSTWVIAGALVGPLVCGGWPVATLIWALVVVVVQVLLKKHNCSGCYYYGKNCHLGWGRIAAWLFSRDSGSMKTGMRLSLFYIVSPPIFLVAAILVGVMLDVGTQHWVLLGLYVALNAAVVPLRIRGCGLCAMRQVCPGSAVR